MCETLLEMTTPFAGSYYGPRVQASRHRGGRPRGRGRQVVRQGRRPDPRERPGRGSDDGQGHGPDPFTGHGQGAPTPREGRRGREGRRDPHRVWGSGGGRSDESDGSRPADRRSFGAREIDRTASAALDWGGIGRAGRAAAREGTEREPGRAPGDRSARSDYGGRRAQGGADARDDAQARDLLGPTRGCVGATGAGRRGADSDSRPSQADL